jgi:DNA-binding MarR family transcriptional regulator
MTTPVDAYRLLIADVYELAGSSRRTAEALAGEHGQTAARWHVLSVVSEDSLTVAAAARRLGQARQSVQRVVNDLRADGLVTSSANPRDRRAPLVAPTPRGRTVLEQLQAASERDRADLLARCGLETADLDRARATVQALAAALRDDGGRDVRGAGGRSPRR